MEKMNRRLPERCMRSVKGERDSKEQRCWNCWANGKSCFAEWLEHLALGEEGLGEGWD